MLNFQEPPIVALQCMGRIQNLRTLANQAIALDVEEVPLRLSDQPKFRRLRPARTNSERRSRSTSLGHGNEVPGRGYWGPHRVSIDEACRSKRWAFPQARPNWQLGLTRPRQSQEAAPAVLGPVCRASETAANPKNF